jgi:hypothetical protein
LLLQLATQLAAAALLFSKHQPNPSAASIHDLHSFTAKKKRKRRRFKYSFIDSCERKIDRISLDFCAKKVKFFGFCFVSIFVHKDDDCIFFLWIFFQGARFTIRFLLIFVQEEEEEGRIFIKKNSISRILFCFAQEEGGLQIKRRGFTDLDSTVVMGQSFQFSFLILEFQSPN